MKILIFAAALVALIITGLASSRASSNDKAAPAAVATAGARTGKYDLANGRKIFENYCTSCHSVGVSLQTFKKTVYFIKHPAYPMPKFYPDPLTERDVEDVAAYIQSI